jgi:DNA modification methylase
MIIKQEEITNVGQVKPNNLIQGDCLEVMKFLADKSIDMVLCDLPYG